MGHRRASRFGRVALAIAVAACAPSGDPVPPTPTPEPLAMAGQEPIRQPLRPAKPFMAIRNAASVRMPPSGTHPAAIETAHAAPQPVSTHPGAKIRVDSAALERAITKEFAYQPLSVALAKRTSKTELADRIAAAVIYEAERNRMSPSLLAAVLLIENAPFDTTAISSQGAVGLMQVMPVHIGSYGCPSKDLHSVEANICHGARILKSYIRRANSVPVGLIRYNGCVRGRNTPRCHRYPGRVLRTASKLRHDMLVSAAGLESESANEAAVAVPSQPVLEDTRITTASASANTCSTLMGCLRQRWSSR